MTGRKKFGEENLFEPLEMGAKEGEEVAAGSLLRS